MPRLMTQEEAPSIICPHMSRLGAMVYCYGNRCAGWGWVDGEAGQMGDLIGEMINVYKGEDPPPNPDGGHWVKVSSSTYTDGWACHKIIGPRRGQCEAMSPQITVEAP